MGRVPAFTWCCGGAADRASILCRAGRHFGLHLARAQRLLCCPVLLRLTLLCLASRRSCGCARCCLHSFATRGRHRTSYQRSARRGATLPPPMWVLARARPCTSTCSRTSSASCGVASAFSCGILHMARGSTLAGAVKRSSVGSTPPSSTRSSTPSLRVPLALRTRSSLLQATHSTCRWAGGTPSARHPASGASVLAIGHSSRRRRCGTPRGELAARRICSNSASLVQS